MKSRKLALASIVALAIASGAAFAQGRDGGAWHGGGGAARGDGGGWHGNGGGWHGDGGGWRDGGGGWHGGGWRGGWYGPAIGFSFGIPGYWGWPYAYGYPYAYPAPYPVYAPSEPSAYIEDSTQAPQASGPIYWYYCTDPQGYYPYVQNCTKPWVQVLPQSVPGGQNAPTPSR